LFFFAGAVGQGMKQRSGQMYRWNTRLRYPAMTFFDGTGCSAACTVTCKRFIPACE
jgi:hypothetical protein